MGPRNRAKHPELIEGAVTLWMRVRGRWFDKLTMLVAWVSAMHLELVEGGVFGGRLRRG